MAAEALAKKTALSLFGDGGLFAGVFHGGGVVGRGGTRRRVPAALAPLFAMAPRYHSGGIAGLKPNEVPAILERGETVLTENQTDALAQQQRPGPGIRVVNVFDPSFVPDQMDSPAGERVFMNIIGRNPRRVR